MENKSSSQLVAEDRVHREMAALADLGQRVRESGKRYQFSLDGRTYTVKAIVPMTPEQASNFAAELETATGKPVTWEES